MAKTAKKDSKITYLCTPVDIICAHIKRNDCLTLHYGNCDNLRNRNLNSGPTRMKKEGTTPSTDLQAYDMSTKNGPAHIGLLFQLFPKQKTLKKYRIEPKKCLINNSRNMF